MTLAAERLDNMTSPNATAFRYAIDPGVSRLTIRAFATGFLSVFGHNPVIRVRSLTGTAEVADDTLDGAALQVAVTTDSLRVENNINDKDRKEMQRAMDEEVLEAKRFPEIAYECSRVTGDRTGENQVTFVLQGDLTLHGVTRNEPISGRAFVTGEMLRASGEFVLHLSDYQIKPVSAVGGGLKLKDEVKINFEVMARKQG